MAREAYGDRWLKTGLAVSLVVHTAALAAIAWLPPAMGAAPGGFEEIRVFDREAASFPVPVELVELPPEEIAPAAEGLSVEIVARPETQPQMERQREPAPAVRRPEPEPERTEPEIAEASPTPTERPEPTGAAEGEPAEGEPAEVEEPGGGGGGGGWVDLGSPSPAGDLPILSGATPGGTVPGSGSGSGSGEGPGRGGGSGGGSGGGVGTGEGSGAGPGSGSGSGEAGGGGFQSRVADRRVPEVVSKGALEYPASAAADGAEGRVKLKVMVTEEGRVAEVGVAESSGDTRLDAAAAEFVRGWRYLPAVQNGTPRRVYTHATVEFELR